MSKKGCVARRNSVRTELMQRIAMGVWCRYRIHAARTPLDVPGLVHHVWSRGIERRKIFLRWATTRVCVRISPGVQVHFFNVLLQEVGIPQGTDNLNRLNQPFHIGELEAYERFLVSIAFLTGGL